MKSENYNKKSDPEKHVMNNQMLELVMKNITFLKNNKIYNDNSIPEDLKNSIENAYIHIACYLYDVKNKYKCKSILKN